MKRYFNALKSSGKLIAKNWVTWLLFIVFYNVVSITLYTSITYLLYMASLKISGVSYLAANTMGQYFLNPFTWLYILISIVLSLFFIMLEMSALYQLYDASRRNEKIGLFAILLKGSKAALRSLPPRNWLLYLYTLLMLPILGISMASNMSYSLFIPGFTMNAIKEMKFVYILLIVVLILLLLFACFLQYSVCSFSLDGCSFKEAVKKSKRLIKGRFFYSVLSAVITYLLSVLVFCLLGAMIGAIIGVFMIANFANALYLGILFGLIFASFIGPAILIAQLSSLYFDLSSEKNEPLPETIDNTIEEKKKPQIIGKTIITTLFLACMAMVIAFNVTDTSLNTVKMHTPEIAAHRGDSGNAPENTMPAFEQAIKDGCCDWIELDVHQTKDKVLVVTHDDSLSRIDGSSRYVHEMTYEELLQVDFGLRFSKEYEGTKVATLNEVLDYCKGKIKLQIEIKPTEFDDHIEEEVVNEIKDHDMVKDCVVLSLKDTPLKRIKEIDPQITTMYCMAFAAGELTNIDFAEYISIEEQNVTVELINSMHAQNRKCFVWTIDDASSVQYLIDCGADVILTDYPVDIKKALDQSDYSGGLNRTLRLFMNS